MSAADRARSTASLGTQNQATKESTPTEDVQKDEHHSTLAKVPCTEKRRTVTKKTQDNRITPAAKHITFSTGAAASSFMIFKAANESCAPLRGTLNLLICLVNCGNSANAIMKQFSKIDKRILSERCQNSLPFPQRAQRRWVCS